jgi:hypothetical protein
MGLNTRGTTSSNKTFLNVFQGNMILEYPTKEALESKLEYLGIEFDPEKEACEDGKMHVVNVRQKTKGKNEGKDVFYYILNDVSGMMTNIHLNENDYGEFLELEFTDVDEKYSVSLGDVYSRMSKDFIRRVGNINLTDELVFGVWNITAEEADNGKPKSGVKMYQDDTKLEYFIDYDELPEPTTKMKGRKKIWDFTEQEQFLYEALVEFKATNFKDESVADEPKEEDKPAKPARKSRANKKQDADDLPF